MVGVAAHDALDHEDHSQQVNDPADELLRARYPRDVREADDLPCRHDLDAVLLLAELEGHVFPGQMLLAMVSARGGYDSAGMFTVGRLKSP
jgi:hypothetical protein